MTAFISKKQSLLILFAGLCAAAAAAPLLGYLLAGPRLGPLYDWLRERRPAPPVSREILLIETGEIVEPGDVFTVLMALSEMNASNLVIEVPVLGSSLGRTASDEEIRRRFNDEYALLGRNIRNLFEAIRVGSVAPSESSRYVENLVMLAEQGRDRLTSALVRQNGAGLVLAAKAAAVFGSVVEAEDLRSRPPADMQWYARPRPDRDGKIRRIAPLLAVEGEVFAGDNSAGMEMEENAAPDEAAGVPPAAFIEHIIYRALKSRWEESAIEYTEYGPELVLRKESQPPEDPADESRKSGETRIPLDREGNILIEKVRQGEGFRRVELARFREYEEAGRSMRLLLKEAEALGIYSETLPERRPPILYDYAASLRDELLEAPEPRKLAAWIAARSEYFASLEELLYGPPEMTLVAGYEESMASEKLTDQGIAKLRNLRDRVIRAFADLREQHRQLTGARKILADNLAASFCVMGPAAGPVESSAALANSLLTGGHITAGQTRYVLFWSFLAAFAVLAGIHGLRPAALLIAVPAAVLICAAGFGWAFVVSAYWIDPLIPAGSCLAGGLVIFGLKSSLVRRGARRFRLAYGPAVNRACLAELVRAGRPRLSETIVTGAAVIAVKNPELRGRHIREEPLTAFRASAEFRGAASLALKKAGAVILSYEDDTVLACFGSPPERVCREAAKTGTPRKDSPGAEVHPAARACACIAALRTGGLPWYFGIDYGECAFFWSSETGYTASGGPAARARLLASAAARRRIRALVTGPVRRQTTLPARKLGTMASSAPEQGGEIFYELQLTEEQPAGGRKTGLLTRLVSKQAL